MGCTRNKGTFWLHQGDALDFLTGIEDASVDLMVTDPPYASLEKHRAVGTTTRLSLSKASSNVWFPTIANEAFGPLFRQMYRVLAKDAHLYLFCDSETAFRHCSAGNRGRVQILEAAYMG